MKCNTTFEDGTNFCPKCGSKLVDVDVCPQCGSPISKEDVFCKKCGHRLKEEVKKEEPAPVVAKAPEEPKERSEKPLQIMNMVICSVLFLAILFLVIGVFGDMYVFSSPYLGLQNVYGIKYFVHDGPISLSKIASYEWANDSYYTYELMCFIAESFLYFSGMVLCIVFTIIALVKNIKAISNKAEPNLKFSFAAGASMLPIMLLYFGKYNAGGSLGSIYLDSKFGWGGGLIIAALAIILVCHITSKIFVSIYKKQNIAPTIIRSGVALVLFILLFNVFGPLTKLDYTYSGVTTSISLNGYAFSETALQGYSSTPTGNSAYYNIFISGMFSLLFTIAGLCMLFFAYRSTLKENKVSPIVMSGLSMLFLVIAAVCSTSATEEYIRFVSGATTGLTFSFGSAPIVGIVMLNLVMASLIVSSALTKKEE